MNSSAVLLAKIQGTEMSPIERLKLLRYAWFHGGVYFHSRKHTLLEILFSFFPSIRHNTEDEEAVLYTLCTILEDVSTEEHHKGLCLRSNMMQPLVSLLNRVIKALPYTDEAYTPMRYLVKTWTLIFQSETLAKKYFTKIENIITVCGLIFQLTYGILAGQNLMLNEALDLLTVAFNHLKKSISHLHPNKINALVLRKLLIQTVTVSQLMKKNNLPNAPPLEHFIVNCIKSGQQTDVINTSTSSIHYFNVAMSILQDPSSSEECLLDVKSIKILKSLCDFIPVMLNEIISPNNSSDFQRYEQLLNAAMTREHFLYKSVDDATILSLICRVLESMHNNNIYNAVEDGHHDRKQLFLLRRILSHLMMFKKKTMDWMRCTCWLLRLNHHILDNDLNDVLRKCWDFSLIANPPHDECFLSQCLSVYRRLHQLNKYFTALFQMLHALHLSETAVDLYPDTFVNTVARIVEMLDGLTLLRIADLALNECIAYLDEKEKFQGRQLEIVTGLLSHILLHSQIHEMDSNLINGQKFTDFLNKLRLSFLQPVMQSAIIESNVLTPRQLEKVMLVAYTWAEIELLRDRQSLDDRQDSPDTSESTDMSCLHYFLSSVEWISLFKTIKCPFTASLFQLQKLRYLLQKHDREDSCINNLVNDLMNMHNLSLWPSSYKKKWNGLIVCINGESSLVGHCYNLLTNFSIMAPYLSSDQILKFSAVIVQAARFEPGDSCQESTKFSYTINKLCRGVFSDPECHEVLEFIMALCHGVWKTLSSMSGRDDHVTEISLTSCYRDVVSAACLCVESSIKKVEFSPDFSKLCLKVKEIAKMINSPDLSVEIEIGNILSCLKLLENLPLRYLPDRIVTCNVMCWFSQHLVTLTLGDNKDPQFQESLQICEHQMSSLLPSKKSPKSYLLFSPKVLFSWIKCYAARQLIHECLDRESIAYQLLKVFLQECDDKKFSSFIHELLRSISKEKDILPIAIIAVILFNAIGGILQNKNSNMDDILSSHCDDLNKLLSEILDYLCSAQRPMSVDNLTKALSLFRNVARVSAKCPSLQIFVDKYFVILYTCTSAVTASFTEKTDMHHIRFTQELIAFYILSLKRQCSSLVASNEDNFLKTFMLVLSMIGHTLNSDSVIFSCHQLRQTFNESVPVSRTSRDFDSTVDEYFTEWIKSSSADSIARAKTEIISLISLRDVARCVTALYGLTCVLPTLLKCVTDSTKSNIMVSFVSEILAKCSSFLREISGAELNIKLWDVVALIFTVYRHFLSSHNSAQFEHCIGIIYSSLIMDCSEKISSKSLPVHIYEICFMTTVELLEQVLQRTYESARDKMSTLVALCNNLIGSFVIKASNQRSFESRDIAVCSRMAASLTKLLSLFSKSEDFSRFALFVISSYIASIASNPPHNQIKKIMDRGLYDILALCDERSIRYLVATLPADICGIFKDFHSDFTKYFKYSGKV